MLRSHTPRGTVVEWRSRCDKAEPDLIVRSRGRAEAATVNQYISIRRVPVTGGECSIRLNFAAHAARFGLRRDGFGLLRWLLDLVGDPGMPRWLDEVRAHLDCAAARSNEAGMVPR